MPAGIPTGAMCVQRFDDSLNSAIRITYRISLRSSSMPEPRDPLLKVVLSFFFTQTYVKKWFCLAWRADPPRQRSKGSQGFRDESQFVMIPPLVHQRRPCYDFYFL